LNDKHLAKAFHHSSIVDEAKNDPTNKELTLISNIRCYQITLIIVEKGAIHIPPLTNVFEIMAECTLSSSG